MFKKNNKNNEEVIKMEESTFIKRHAKKILVAGGLVVSAGAAYMMYKHGLEIKDLLNKHDVELKNKDVVIEGLSEVLKDTREDNRTLMEALSEGVFEEAIATVTRKINSRKDKLTFLERQLEKGNTADEVLAKIEEITFEIAELIRRKESFLEGQHLYEIKNLED